MTFKNFFKDKKGNIVIIQKPNFLVFAAIIFFMVQLIFNDEIQMFASWGFKVVLLIWSIDEILRGDSPFRRILGLATGAYILINIILQIL